MKTAFLRTLVFFIFSATALFTDHLPGDKPLIIAHRGSSGMLPEHTVEAYKLAVDQGADVIECDVAISKDLKLLCTHESWLNMTTDVHFRPEFKDRVRSYFIPALNETKTDYFTIDFTLDELKSLKRVQVNSFRDQAFNYKFPMASFEDYVKVAQNPSNPKPIIIYPETKNPEFFNIFLQNFDTNMEDLVLEALQKYGYTKPDSPGFIQSFSAKSLRYLSQRTKLPLVYLTKVSLSDSDLRNLSDFVSVVCPDKKLIVEVNPESNFVRRTTDFIKRAKKYGLKVHTYTFRNEYQFLAYDYGADPYREYEKFIKMGISGMFTDFPWSLHNYLKKVN